MRPEERPPGRVLALDVGERRIGLAISDPDGRVAVPLETLERRSEDADLHDLAGLVDREGVQLVVVGLPLSLDGGVGRQAERTQEFARRLAEALSRPVEMWDERLSSVAAERSLLPPGASDRAERRRPRVGERRRPARGRQRAQDALAAALILQSYLDSRRRPPSGSAGGGPAPGGGRA